LDRKLRESMQVEIKRIHRETGATIVFVTHDQEEALALSDRICLMNAGRIEQIGSPEDIYERPGSVFVADFIGISNKLQGEIVSSGSLSTPDGVIPLPASTGAPHDGRQANTATIIVRPEHLRVADSGHVRGVIVERIYGGSETRLLVRLASDTILTVRQPAGSAHGVIGETVALDWDVAHSRLLDH
jgi:putative spermidine/putrescine transport system ATP-binding protein